MLGVCQLVEEGHKQVGLSCFCFIMPPASGFIPERKHKRRGQVAVYLQQEAENAKNGLGN